MEARHGAMAWRRGMEARHVMEKRYARCRMVENGYMALEGTLRMPTSMGEDSDRVGGEHGSGTEGTNVWLVGDDCGDECGDCAAVDICGSGRVGSG